MARSLILIVDDDPNHVALLRDVLEHHGYRVAKAASGEECLRSVEREAPAVILMDIQMPGMGGVATIRALRSRADTARMRVVALTASVMPHEVASFQSIGFDAFHPKPVDIARLLREIEALVADSQTGPTSTASPRGTGS